MTERDASGWLADRLSGARADAARIVRELTDKGHLTPEQATTIAAAVDSAITRGRELVADALREPRRVLDGLRGTTTSEAEASRATAPSESRDSTSVTTSADVPASIPAHVQAHLDALEARIVELEAALLQARSRARHGSEGD